MLILIYLIVLIVGLLVAEHIYKRCSSLSKLPCPPSLPFIGNALVFSGLYGDRWKNFHECIDKYYPTMCLWISSKPVVLIRHPDDIQVLLKSNSNINKADMFYSCIRKYGNDGIIISGGAKWQERRKLLNQAFVRRSSKYVVDSANTYVNLLIQQMLLWEDKSIQNTLPLMLKFTLDIICDTAMGYDLHTVGAHYEEEYREAFQGSMDLVFDRIFRPYLKDWMVKYLPLGKKLRSYKNIINAFARRVIEERRNYHTTNNINLLSDDFDNSLKKNNDAENAEDKSSNGYNLVDLLCVYDAKGLIDEQGMLEELETLVAAGYETTGTASAFLLFLLAENEREQDLARKEVTDVMKKCGNKLTISEVQNLQYIDRCIKETLRLFPSAPMIGRKLAEDMKFGKYIIPRNTDVFVNIYDVQRDPKFWSEPNKFNPDRFLPEFSKDRHPFAYVPFSGGLRNCIGQKFAVIEMKILMAHILTNFYLKPVDFIDNMSFEMGVTLKPNRHKLRVKFIKILEQN